MRATLVTIADTDETARTLDLYLRSSLGEDTDSYFMTYRRTLLSGTLVRRMDLLILELLARDNEGYRAEGIFGAEKWAMSRKRVLIVSGAARSDSIDCPGYWDLAAQDLLSERIRRLIDAPPIRIADLAGLKKQFSRYCRPAVDFHRRDYIVD